MNVLFDEWYKSLEKSLHKPRKGSVQIRFRWQKKQKSLSTGLKNPKQVTEGVQKEKLLEWWGVENKRLHAAPEPVKRLPILDRIDVFLAEEYKYGSAEHRKGVGAILREMANLLPPKALHEITRKDFREFVVPAMEKGLAAHTWANKLTTMGKYFRWEMLQEDEEGVPHLEKDPTLGVKRPPKSMFGTREQIWEEAWFEPVYTALEYPYSDIFEDLWFTGMDTKDIWQFQPRKHLLAVHGETGRWKIYKKRAKEAEIIDQPLNSRLGDRWARRREECGPEDYLHPDGRRFANEKSWNNQVRKAVNRVQDKLGLPRVDLKSIRHTFATRYARMYIESRSKKGPPPDELRRWMGHAVGSRVLEKIYVRLKSDPSLMD